MSRLFENLPEDPTEKPTAEEPVSDEKADEEGAEKKEEKTVKEDLHTALDGAMAVPAVVAKRVDPFAEAMKEHDAQYAGLEGRFHRDDYFEE